MRQVNNIFEQESSRGKGIPRLTEVTITYAVCTFLSLIGMAGIIINFDEITSEIAILVANLLTSGVMILLVVAVVIYLFVGLKWHLRRKFWGL